MEDVVWDKYSNNYILDLDNKEKIKKDKIPWHRRTESCEYCGSKLLLVNKARHEKSTKHKDGKYLTSDRFEMD